MYNREALALIINKMHYNQKLIINTFDTTSVRLGGGCFALPVPKSRFMVSLGLTL